MSESVATNGTTPVSFVVGEPDTDAEEKLENEDSFPDDMHETMTSNVPIQQTPLPGLVERRKRLR